MNKVKDTKMCEYKDMTRDHTNIVMVEKCDMNRTNKNSNDSDNESNNNNETNNSIITT